MDMRFFLVTFLLVSETLEGFNCINAVEMESDLFQPIETLDCISMQSSDGNFASSPNVGDTTCGLYLAGEPDTRVQIEFPDFHVDCETRSLVAVLDGWERGGEVFPALNEVPEDQRHNRYSTFCGTKRPNTFTSSGNMALIQYQIGNQDKFVIKVKFIKNPRPCNMVVVNEQNKIVLKNYRMTRNCSALFVTPQNIKMSLINIGKIPVEHRWYKFGSFRSLSSSIKLKFFQRYHADCRSDYIEFLGGATLALNDMNRFDTTCRRGSSTSLSQNIIFCEIVLVRLISSGQYDNTVILHHEDILEKETGSLGPPAKDGGNIYYCASQ